MTLREKIAHELGDEFDITKIEITRDTSRGRPGTSVDLIRRGTLTNSWFFAAVNKMNYDDIVSVMKSYLKNDKR